MSPDSHSEGVLDQSKTKTQFLKLKIFISLTNVHLLSA